MIQLICPTPALTSLDNSTRTEQIVELVNTYSPIVTKISAEDVEHYLFEEQDDQVIACVRIQRVSWYQWELSHLVTEPEHRGRGLAHRLVRRACQEIRRQGGLVVQCTIRCDGLTSQRVVSRLDFTPGVRFVGLSGRELQVWQKPL